MTPTIEETGKQLSETEIEALESRVGGRLPAEYRSFLMRYNGGYPVPDAFNFAGAETGSSVQAFYSVTGPHKEDRFDQVLEIYGGRVPEGLLPFAYDPGGNLICISYLGPGVGRVFFWDHEQEAEDGEKPNSDNLRLVAESFDEFIDGLYDLSG